MRAIGLSDLVAAARAAEAFPKDSWPQLFESWLDQAHAADKYRKKFRRSHRIWGCGSLASRVAGASPVSLCAPQGLMFRASLGTLLAAIAQRQEKRGVVEPSMNCDQRCHNL